MQVCPLQISSFGHDTSQVALTTTQQPQVTYKWADPAASLDDIELSQYHFIKWHHGSEDLLLR